MMDRLGLEDRVGLGVGPSRIQYRRTRRGRPPTRSPRPSRCGALRRCARLDRAKEALTELSQEAQSKNTHIMVERIIADIDDIAKKVRFPDWQHTSQGERLVQKELRRTLLKYQLGLSATLLSLFLLAGAAFAQTGPPASTMVSVSGTNALSNGYASWVDSWAPELIDRWGRTYGWMPSQKMNVYLYTAGTDMADALATFQGTALSPVDWGYVTMGASVVTTTDTRPGGPGGFDILVDLNSPQCGSLGAGNWQTEVKGAIVMQFAKQTIADLGGTSGPMWLQAGFANYLTQTEVPGQLAPTREAMALQAVTGAGVAPGLLALQNNWDVLTGNSTQPAPGVSTQAGVGISAQQMKDATYAVATDTVRFLIPRIGPQGIINLLKAGSGTSFWNMLMSETGMSSSQLDKAYTGAM